MTKRRLHPDELELWHSVARTAVPRVQPKPHGPEASLPKPAPEVAQPKPVKSFSIGGGRRAPETRDIAPSLSDRLASAPVSMDAKSYKHMKRGKLKPEGRIDLHGMTVAQAHPALTSFVMSAHSSGKRLVLVITGKGGKRQDDWAIAPQRMGALKRQVPHWLTQAPMSQVVMQVTEAHIRHGGTGAYYVYLRRTR